MNNIQSVSDIIRLMELEHRIQKGEIKRSALQDALEKRGFGRRQLNHYSSDSLGASRRFERQHRNELWQADIKYLLVLPAADGKPKRQIYASAFIDDATRLVTGLRVYEHQNVHCVLDYLKGAVERCLQSGTGAVWTRYSCGGSAQRIGGMCQGDIQN